MKNRLPTSALILSALMIATLASDTSDCVFHNYLKGTRITISKSSIFYKKIIRTRIRLNTVYISLCQPLPHELIKNCPHSDSKHRYVIFNQNNCVMYSKGNFIENLLFPSVYSDKYGQSEGGLQLKFEHAKDSDHRDYRLHGLKNGNLEVYLFYKGPKGSSGVIEERLYPWPKMVYKEIFSGVRFLFIGFSSLFLQRDNRYYLIMQIYLILAMAVETFIELFWLDLNLTPSIILLTLPLVAIVAYVVTPRSTKMEMSLNKSFHIAGVICFISSVVEYPQSPFKIFAWLALTFFGVVIPYLVCKMAIRDGWRQKEAIMSIINSVFFCKMLKEVSSFYLLKTAREDIEVLALFKIIHSFFIAKNGKVYASMDEQAWRFWISMMPILYTPMIIRFFIVEKRIKKINKMRDRELGDMDSSIYDDGKDVRL